VAQGGAEECSWGVQGGAPCGGRGLTVTEVSTALLLGHAVCIRWGREVHAVQGGAGRRRHGGARGRRRPGGCGVAGGGAWDHAGTTTCGGRAARGENRIEQIIFHLPVAGWVISLNSTMLGVGGVPYEVLHENDGARA
jgi:hypothetical protein